MIISKDKTKIWLNDREYHKAMICDNDTSFYVCMEESDDNANVLMLSYSVGYKENQLFMDNLMTGSYTWISKEVANMLRYTLDDSCIPISDEAEIADFNDVFEVYFSEEYNTFISVSNRQIVTHNLTKKASDLLGDTKEIAKQQYDDEPEFRDLFFTEAANFSLKKAIVYNIK
jgi:hypothetical protein